MIPAKRLAELRQVGWDPTYAEILELVTAYEAAREFAPLERIATGHAMSWDEHEAWLSTRRKFLDLFPEPTK